MIRFFVWSVVRLLIFLLLPVILVAMVLFVPRFFQMGLSVANRFLPVTINVGEFRHSPGKLTLGDVHVFNNMGPLFELGRLYVEYNPRALLSGEVDIEKISLEKANARCVRLPDGRWNFSGPPNLEEDAKKPSSAFGWSLIPFRLEIRQIRLESGSFDYQDGSENLQIKGEGILLEGSFDGEGHKAGIAPLKGKLKVGAFSEALTTVAFEISGRVEEDLLEISRVDMEADDASLDLEGTGAADLREFSMTGSFEDLPLARILAVLGVRGIPVERVSGHVAAQGKGIQDIRVSTELDTVFRGQSTQITMEGSLREKNIQVDSLLLKQPGLTCNAQGSLSLASRDIAASFVLTSPSMEEGFGSQKGSGLRVEHLRATGEVHGTLADPRAYFGLQAARVSMKDPLVEGLFLYGMYSGKEGFLAAGRAEKAFVSRGAAAAGMKFAGRYRNGLCSFSIGADPAFFAEGRYRTDTKETALTFMFREAAILPLFQQWLPTTKTSRFVVSGGGIFQGDLNNTRSWEAVVRLSDIEMDMPDSSISNDQPLILQVDNGLVSMHASALINKAPLLLDGYLPLVKDRSMRVRGRVAIPLPSCQGLISAYLPQVREVGGYFEIDGQAEGPIGNPEIDARIRIEKGHVLLVSQEPRSLEEVGVPPEEIFNGSFDISGHFQGPVRTPLGDLDVTLSKGAFRGVPLQVFHLSASSPVQKDWDVAAQMKTPYGSWELNGGWEPFTGKVDGTLKTTQWDLTALLASKNIPVEGQGRVTGTLSGTLGAPEVGVNVEVDSVRWKGADYGDTEADLKIHSGKLDLDCRIGSNRLKGSVALDKTLSTTLEGSFEQFPVGPIMNELTHQPWDGNASFSGQVGGSLSDKRTWVGELSVPYVSMTANGVPIHLEQPSKVVFSPGQVMFPESIFRINNDSELLYVKGIFAKNNLLAFHGATAVSPILFLFPWFQLEEARAEGNFEISGDWKNPNISGELNLTGTEFKLTSVPVVADRVKGVMKGIGKGLRFDPIQAEIDEGKAEIKTQFVWEPTFILQELTVDFDTVPVRFTDEIMARAKGRFSFVETMRETSTLNADLQIVEGIYNPTFKTGLARIESNIGTLQTVLGGWTPRTWQLWQRSAFLQNMRLNVTITSGPELYVRNSMVQMVLSADLKVAGTVANPKPSGRVKVVRGILFYGTNKFTITQGSLVFSEAAGIVPTVDLDAYVTVNRYGGEYQAGRYSQRYVVYLHVEGPMDQAQLTLRSVPELSEQDIFYLLLTGKTMQEYYDAGSVGGTNTGQNLAISGVSSLFGSDVQHYTGLDIFSLSGTDTTQAGVKATVGKQLSDRVGIRGTVFMGQGQDPSEAAVEYQVTDWLLVVGTQRVDGSFGVDVRLRFIGD